MILLGSFMELWKKFHDVLDNVVKSRSVKDEDEGAFLAIKTEIAHQQARLHQVLDWETHFTDEVMGVLSQIISLKDYVSLSSTQVKRIESQWHNLFILMHGELGKLEAAVEIQKSRRFLSRVVKNPWFILVLVIGISAVLYSLFGQKWVR